MADDLKEIAAEVHQLIQSNLELISALVGRADENFRLRLALESKWLSVKRRSESQTEDYFREIEKIHSLALDYSKWIKDNPEIGQGFFKSALADSNLTTREAKVEFMKKLRNDRRHRLEVQIPKLEAIVESVEHSVERLRNIVGHSY